MSASRFFGRREERDSFLRALAESRTGCLRRMLIRGPAGIGKTRLAGELARKAEEAGFLVLAGAWREDVTLPEYWLRRQVLRRLMRNRRSGVCRRRNRPSGKTTDQAPLHYKHRYPDLDSRFQPA